MLKIAHLNGVFSVSFRFLYRLQFFIKCVLSCSCLLFAGSTSAQNLIVNPDFPMGFTSPWGGGSCTIESGPETNYGGANNSNYLVEIDEFSCIREMVCIIPGTTYKLSLQASRSINNLTPVNPGFVVTVTGLITGAVYLNQTTFRNNTSWDLTTSDYTFTIPPGDNEIYIIVNFERVQSLTGTSGIVLDNIELHPAADMFISGITAQSLVVEDSTYQLALANTRPGIAYNWNFDAGSTPVTSSSATPSVSWSTSGLKNISVAIQNGACTVYNFGLSFLVSGTLPLQFNGLSGNVENEQATITWTTSDETNTSYFVIERSPDGMQFQAIDWVKCRNTPGEHKYSYTDKKYTSPSFYRLKQVDLNGNAHFSSVINLKSVTDKFRVNLFPSTTNTALTYTITAPQPVTAVVQVVNTSGQTIVRRTIQLLKGVNVQHLNVSQLSAGNYFLKVSIPGQLNGISNVFVKG